MSTAPAKLTPAHSFAVDQVRLILMRKFDRGGGVVALLPIRAQGGFAFPQVLSDNFAASGRRTLLVDFRDNATRSDSADEGRAAKVLKSAGLLEREAGASGDTDRIRERLREVADGYDIVICSGAGLFGTDPAPPVNPLVVAAAADAVILLCDASSDRADDVRRALHLLGEVGANCIGSVLDQTASRPVASIAAGAIGTLSRFAPATARRWQQSASDLLINE